MSRALQLRHMTAVWGLTFDQFRLLTAAACVAVDVSGAHGEFYLKVSFLGRVFDRLERGVEGCELSFLGSVRNLVLEFG